MPRGFQDVHLEIQSTVDQLDHVQEVADQVARTLGMDEDTLHWTTMAVRESVINAIAHGNKHDASKRVLIDFSATPPDNPEILIVSVRDQGDGFNPETVHDPLSPENVLKASGRGIFLIKCFMDEVVIQPAKGGGTEMRMKKRLRPHAE